MATNPARTRTLKDIDPEMARGLIVNSSSEESLDAKHFHEIVSQMKKGRFSTYGICLEIDSRGHLISGLPYLQAIVESGATIRMWIAENKD